MLKKKTYWIEEEDNPLIIHEGNSVVIEVKDLNQGWALDIFLAPTFFNDLRKAMDKAEHGANGSVTNP